ncbi:MAG: nucleotidyltransferase family protein [Halioglobus sp.]
MNRARPFELQRVLLEPRLLQDLDNRALSSAISQGRVSRLLASLACETIDHDILEALDARVRRHLESALRVHEKQQRDLRYDVESIRAALATVELPLVLLKGAAYMHSQLRVGAGRLITDIDIIVPREHLASAEQALNAHGWESAQLDPYNERYYRQWSHETPALVNRARGTTLDLHHNILPPTAKPNVDAALLFERLREVCPGVFTLSYQDMLIHSATHLFHEGEFHHGLRDLWDIDRMLRDFPTHDADFWSGLVIRARELDLQDSLFHGLVYAQRVFGTPVPDEVMAATRTAARRLRGPLMDFLFLRAFRPAQPGCQLAFTSLALNLLYLRSHYLRMPLYLLVPHLIRKALMRQTSSAEETLAGKTPAR